VRGVREGLNILENWLITKGDLRRGISSGKAEIYRRKGVDGVVRNVAQSFVQSENPNQQKTLRKEEVKKRHKGQVSDCKRRRGSVQWRKSEKGEI